MNKEYGCYRFYILSGINDGPSRWQSEPSHWDGRATNRTTQIPRPFSHVRSFSSRYIAAVRSVGLPAHGRMPPRRNLPDLPPLPAGPTRQMHTKHTNIIILLSTHPSLSLSLPPHLSIFRSNRSWPSINGGESGGSPPPLATGGAEGGGNLSKGGEGGDGRGGQSWGSRGIQFWWAEGYCGLGEDNLVFHVICMKMYR